MEDRLFYGQSFHDIIQRLSDGEVSYSSVLAQPDQQDWKPLLKVDSFASFLIKQWMIAATGQSHETLFNHWYIQEDSMSYGPFSFLQMLELYQQKRIREDTRVGHSFFSNWQKLSLCEPFSQESLESLLNCSLVLDTVNRRRHPRIQYSNEVFVSTRAELYRGVTWSLSTGGLGLLTDGSTQMEIEHRVNIIVNANYEHGPIQVKGHVVNIQKESNYERVAIEFEDSNELFDQYLNCRVPEVDRVS